MTRSIVAAVLVGAALSLVACKGDETPAGVSYRNCDEVRAAGKAPIKAGEPGFKSDLDRDGDGVACDK